MPDCHSPLVRSRNMAAVRRADTTPERRVRSLLHRAGFRFRLHVRELPGSPDLVLPKYKTVIFVHGCFWHQHSGCPKAKRPTTRVLFWNKKLDDNVARDLRASSALALCGWRVVVVWECETKHPEAMLSRLRTLMTN